MKGQITVQAVSKVKQNEITTLKIFPNPVNNNIQWEYSGIDLKRVAVLSIDGKKLNEWNVNNKITSVPLGELSPGSYFLTGYSDDQQLFIQQF